MRKIKKFIRDWLAVESSTFVIIFVVAFISSFAYRRLKFDDDNWVAWILVYLVPMFFCIAVYKFFSRQRLNRKKGH
jgi:hypothetical protein